MIDTLCENNINTIAEELVSLEDIGTYILMILLSMMDEVSFNLSSTNYQTTWSYSASSFIKSIDKLNDLGINKYT